MVLRRTGTVAAATVLAVLALACQPADQQTDGQAAVDTASIEAAFESMRTSFEAAVKAGDSERQAAIYTEDAIYSPPMEPPVRGRDSIRAALERTTPPGATLEIRPIDLTILGPDRVYEYGVATLTFTPPGADEPASMSSTYFALFRRTADGWRIAREVLNLNQPPPGAGQ